VTIIDIFRDNDDVAVRFRGAINDPIACQSEAKFVEMSRFDPKSLLHSASDLRRKMRVKPENQTVSTG
jgi:hypothetical protein